MEIKSTSIFKRSSRQKSIKVKDGSFKTYNIKGGWFYRVKYVETSGRPRVAEHGPYGLKSDARDEMKAYVRELEASQGRSRDTRNMTFSDLITKCTGPGGIYAEGEVRSRTSILAYTKNLQRYFGNFKLSDISRESLRDYKAKRRRDTRRGPDDTKKQISIATVHRELATLRAMMFYAISELEWTTNNPFFKNRGLIRKKDEAVRDRILSLEEESRLLRACSGTWTVPYERTRKGVKEQLTATFTLDNRHLRAMIVLALDSGMRRGEILKLQWSDIDFETRKITIRPQSTKTNQGRIAPLSRRAAAELQALRSISPKERPFPYTDIKRSFATAKRLAKIEDLHFHDLRSSYVSRLQSRGIATGMVGKVVGHSQIQTTAKHYTVVDDETLDAMRAVVDSYAPTTVNPVESSELVN